MRGAMVSCRVRSSRRGLYQRRLIMFTRRDASTSTQPSREEPRSRTEQPTTTASPMTTPPPAQTPAAQAPAPQPAQAAASGNQSVIAADDTFEGQIKTGTGVRVLGTVRGGIESE